MLLEPFSIGRVEFRNRLFRSSMGGRMSDYDGTVTSVWKNFEKRFAEGGVGAVISTTLDVNKRRESPPNYPPLDDDRLVPALRRYIREIQATGARYIIQIGDPGYQTQTSLFPDPDDGLTSSSGLDLVYGYGLRRAMTDEQIRRSIDEFVRGAERAVATGADGLEITASKGYLIHQFLNPAINRRTDDWGGSLDKRFRFLREIVVGVRQAIGRDVLFGIRLAAEDHGHQPVNLHWPLRWNRRGARLDERLEIGRRLRDLGVDYLHIDSGFGFIHPRVTPGAFPYDEARLFFDHTRHLHWKAGFRAALLHLLPRFLGRWLFNRGWKYREALNLEYARRFKAEVGLPVIANGGFQRRATMDGALANGDCDAIAVARELLANPDLIAQFRAGADVAERPCTHCNRCAARTATSPLGCYDLSRFRHRDEMEAQILGWNRADPVDEPDLPEKVVALGRRSAAR